jgi:nucleotide-binding universal stress UspA family protein
MPNPPFFTIHFQVRYMGDTILVPFELPDPQPLSPVLVADLASLNVVLLGHFQLPEQTPIGAARDQFEPEAKETLQELAEPFHDADASVKTRLVFGKNRSDAIEQIAIEEDTDAELIPAPTEGIEHILVPIPDVAEFSRLPKFVNVLCEGFDQEITLFHVLEGDEQQDRGEQIVQETRDGMIQADFEPDGVNTRIVEGAEHDEAILEVAAEYDAVVMYEAHPELTDRIFGSLPDRIANETGDPVILVRRDYKPK